MMRDDTKLYYDLTAKVTADAWYGIELLKPSIEEFISLLPENPRVLDLGCGPGHEAMRLHTAGAEVVGVDYSEECIKIARERSPQCRFEVMDFHVLDDSLGQFDGVFACASLIHVAPRNLERVFKNIDLVLKQEGLLVAMILVGNGIDEEKSNLTVGDQNLRRTVFCYTKEGLENIAESAGFVFQKEGYLEPSIAEYGWKSFIFKRMA